jgi:H+/gluconate symporter-like permease
MLTSISILALFIIIAILMVTRKLPTLVALPILAIAVALIAGVPLVSVGKDNVDNGILKFIIEGGATRLASAYASVIVGAWLGQLMNQTGVSKTIVKGAAELGGDKPFLVTVLVTAAIAILFTTISGLGAVIMVASIALPILISVGVPGITAACMFLFGMATGLMINLTNWAFYASATGVKQSDVQSFALILCGLTAVVTLTFAIIEFKRSGLKFAWASNASLGTNAQVEFQKAPLLSLLTPVVPIILVITPGLKWPIIPAFIAGIVWCFVTVLIFSPQRNVSKLVSTLTKSAFEGVSDSAPAVILMIGIGMVLNSLMHPVVKESITPLLKAIVPSSTFGYIVFFSILAPLALYRGPLNMWGLGSGIAAVIIGLKVLPAPAVFSAFLSTERVQAVGDPTNTHNVWLANYVGADVNKILLKVMPYIWALAVVGIIVSSIMWF